MYTYTTHRFYANWCKSCARFGQRYRHFAFEEGDHIDIEGSIVHTGKVRFAEVEYSAAAKLCKALRVKKLPTVHMYQLGKGRVADMVCKPSQFQDVVDTMNRLLNGPDGESSQPAMIELEEEIKIPIHAVEGDASKTNVTNTSFESLADEIMTSLKKKEGTVKEEKSWFPFSF